MKKKKIILGYALLIIGLFTGCKQESNNQIDDLMDGIEFDISQHDVENIFLDKSNETEILLPHKSNEIIIKKGHYCPVKVDK